ncbi:MAG: inositol monophosphatase family protein, partial [Bacteroidota bacterium]
VENKIPVLGVIYAPVTMYLYYAAKGIGAYNIANCRLPTCPDKSVIANCKELLKKSYILPLSDHTQKFTIVASRSHFSKETEDFINEMKKIHNEVGIISAGSSLKFCLVAEGKADVYPRFGPTMEWDTAAGQAIVQCAGKNVIDFETKKPMLYNRENLRNGWFVVE